MRGVLAKELDGRDALPGFYALFLDTLGHGLKQLGRARVQRTGFAVNEKRHRHAPLALA